MSIRKAFVALVVVSSFAAGTAALADPPGPGDKQCVPGKHGNPHPGFKAGACPNPDK
jgi:hypothetical protein